MFDNPVWDLHGLSSAFYSWLLMDMNWQWALVIATVLMLAWGCYELASIELWKRRQRRARGSFMPSLNRKVDQLMADAILDAIHELFLAKKISGKECRRLLSEYARVFKLQDLKPRKRKLPVGAANWLKARITVRKGNQKVVIIPGPAIGEPNGEPAPPPAEKRRGLLNTIKRKAA